MKAQGFPEDPILQRILDGLREGRTGDLYLDIEFGARAAGHGADVMNTAIALAEQMGLDRKPGGRSKRGEKDSLALTASLVRLAIETRSAPQVGRVAQSAMNDSPSSVESPLAMNETAAAQMIIALPPHAGVAGALLDPAALYDCLRSARAFRFGDASDFAPAIEGWRRFQQLPVDSADFQVLVLLVPMTMGELETNPSASRRRELLRMAAADVRNVVFHGTVPGDDPALKKLNLRTL